VLRIRSRTVPRPRPRLPQPPIGTALALAALLAAGLPACGGASPATSATLGATPAATAAANDGIAVSPLPGTPDASPATQISFLGGPGTHVSAVRVVGSRSGAHAGVLRAYSTGTGESFLPKRRFLAGERVAVRARVGATPVSTSFRVAHQAAVSEKEFAINPGDPRAVQHYVSAPSLTPSTLRVTTPARPGATPGYLFLAPYQGRGTAGPMIAAQDGSLVWFHPLPAGVQAANFGVQSYQGGPVLAWWQGRIIAVGFGQGQHVLYDSSYRRVATIRAGNGYRADLHELRLTPQGTAWIDAFDPVRMNLSSVRGSARGVLTDSVIQQVDVKTGLVMWEWHALGHIALGESYNPPPRSAYPWDFVHINSADPGGEGDVLLSARNTWGLYDVDIASGSIRWRVGGKRASFRQGPGTRFYWQHDAEFQPDGAISLFDNGASPPRERQSRGLVLRIDRAARSATLVRQLVNPNKRLLAESQGNTQALAGGNWLIGYGRLPNVTEFDASGRVLLDATLGKQVQSFKSLLYAWSGHPTSAPALVARAGTAGTVSLSASWNGATDVAAWRVLSGSSPTTLTALATSSRRGFETAISAHTAAPYVAVQALDAAGGVLATSAPVKP
jgi:hypothetical protein